MAVSRDVIKGATQGTAKASAKATKASAKAPASRSNHPAYAGKKGLEFDFTVENYSGRIHRKMGSDAFKLRPVETSDGSTKFAGRYSNGNLPVLVKNGKPVANPDQIKYTQIYEVDAKGRFIMTLLIGPDAKEANNDVWTDKLVFRMAGKRTSIERIDPYGNVAKGSYTSIQSGDVEGLDFGGIEPERLYRKVELAARAVLERYFDSPAHLLENLTRESTGDTLNASTYAQHGFNFNHENFYTRNFRYFGKEKIHTYAHSKNKNAERYAKTNSVGTFPVYKGTAEQWHVTQVFRYSADGELLASNSLTNYRGAENKSEVEEPVRLALRLTRSADGSYSLNSLMVKGDKNVYSDTLSGSQEEITEQAKKSRKLAWKYLDMPIERSIRLIFRGVEDFESALNGVGVQEEPADVDTYPTQGTANDKLVVAEDGSGNFSMEQAQEFLVPANAGREFNFVYRSKGVDIPVVYKVTDRGAFSAYTEEVYGFNADGTTARVTAGNKLTVSATIAGQSFSKAKNIGLNATDQELSNALRDVNERLATDMHQAGVSGDDYALVGSLHSMLALPVISAYRFKRDGVNYKSNTNTQGTANGKVRSKRK